MTETRRNFLKLAGVAAAGTAVAAEAGPAIDALGKIFDTKYQLPNELLKPATVPSSKEAEANWKKIYRVQAGDTISGIAARFYPDYNNNQSFYDDKVRFANRQERQQNALLYSGQLLYIPDPRIPTLGFAAGEQAILRGQEKDGKYWPTVVGTIDTKAKRMDVNYRSSTVFNGALKVGEKLTTDRPLSIAAVLEGGPSSLVPPRVVFEIIA